MAPLLLAGIGAGLSGLGSLAGGLIGGSSAKKAAQIQAAAADRAREQLGQYYNEAKGFQQPYQAAGQVGLGQLTSQDYTVPYQQYTGQYQAQNAPQAYTGQEFNYDQWKDPGTAFRMQQGQQAIESSAAAQGAGLSGPTLRALAKFGQGLGTQEYGNAYGRYMQGRQQGQSEQAQRYGQFSGQQGFDYGKFIDEYNRKLQAQGQRYGQASQLAGIGQQAAGTMAQMATGQGANIADILGQKANAQAGGVMGAGQAYSGIAQNLGQLGSMGTMLGMMGYGGQPAAAAGARR
jgi:hypothetical protein